MDTKEVFHLSPAAIAADLHARAERLRIPYGDIARRAGVHNNAVTRVMRGQSVLTATLDAVSKAVADIEEEMRVYLAGRAAE